MCAPPSPAAEQDIRAGAAGDAAGAVAVYTDDVAHDVVGWPFDRCTGGTALSQDISTEETEPVRRCYGPDFAVIEHIWRGVVPGSFLSVPGNGKRIASRLLYLWEFRDGCISRENVSLDGGAVVAQLTGA